MDKTKYLLITLVAVTLLTILSPTLTYAQPPATVNIYTWTDKTSYDLGEKGKLTIVIRNDRTDEDLILYNITIMYPWFAYTGEAWEGNDTIIVNEAIPKNGGIKTFTREFTVPSDGRVVTSYVTSLLPISIVIAVDKSPYQYSPSRPPYIYVKSVPLYMSLEDGDKLVTLLTVQVVLLIVCTIIIAATIFLSARRPQVMWKAEEKEE
ncbi:MAG: hypothetical protein QXI91_04525 [Candidatus Bathyarchaeia archaeon]